MIHSHEDITVSRRSTRLLKAIVMFSGVLLLPVTAFAENTVTRWAEHAMQAVRAANVGTPNAGRLYAMVNLAMYDAVNGIDTAQHRGREHALVPATGARGAAIEAPRPPRLPTRSSSRWCRHRCRCSMRLSKRISRHSLPAV